jgi:hypothetical protein
MKIKLTTSLFLSSAMQVVGLPPGLAFLKLDDGRHVRLQDGRKVVIQL